MRKYIAYPFLYDDPKDLRCDFEILTEWDLNWINEIYMFYKNEYKGLVKKFLIPQGWFCICYAHVIRSKCKSIVRIIYVYKKIDINFHILI